MSGHESAQRTAERLRTAFDRELSEVLDSGADVALINFPRFGNLGDAAMWLGELAALDRMGARIRYRCDPRTYRRALLRSAIGEAGTILLHGGGNVGDVYPLQQRVRERILRDFPGARVIQLPQTIWFRNHERMARFGRLCRRHPAFTLMVRERASLDRARDGLGLDAVLAPDAAFALGPLRRPRSPDRDLLWLLREDRERTVLGDPRVAAHAMRREWPDKFGRDVGSGGRGLRMLLRAADIASEPIERHGRLAWALSPLAARTQTPIARRRVTLALDTLATARVVVTDRLHGHILSTLIGIPHVVLDNASGKSRAMYETWTSECQVVRLAEDLDDASALADELLGTPLAPADART